MQLGARPPGLDLEKCIVDPPSEPDKPDQPAARHSQEYEKLPFSEGITAIGSLSFIKSKTTYILINSPKLKNSLLAGVGYLELANAGDFAANVWNKYPVPIYATVFMAIGGTVALGIVYFAIQDARLCWGNLCGLWSERHHLRKIRSSASQDDKMARAADCLLDMNFRETGTEVVDRIGMDICMGFGAFVVGIGTYMAIGGANKVVFRTSNLLSGYIGNGPCALYGLINFLWSCHVWRRGYRHNKAGNKSLDAGPAKEMFTARVSSLQAHSAINGLNGIIAGAASLVTATMWQGYLALAPCIIVSILINNFWRRRVGYTRPFIQQMVTFDKDTLIAELLYIDLCRKYAIEDHSDLSDLVTDPRSINCVLKYMTRHGLFEEFCYKILADAKLATQLTETTNDITTISLERLNAVEEGPLQDRLLKTAQLSISEAAPECLNYRARHLAEVLGCYLTTPGC